MELDFDCHKCDEILKKERGCDGNGSVPFYIDDEQYFRCPIKLATSVSWEYIKAYNLYQKGKLPNGEGWLNESQKFLDAMMVLEGEIKRREVEQLKKRR